MHQAVEMEGIQANWEGYRQFLSQNSGFWLPGLTVVVGRGILAE